MGGGGGRIKLEGGTAADSAGFLPMHGEGLGSSSVPTSTNDDCLPGGPGLPLGFGCSVFGDNLLGEGSRILGCLSTVSSNGTSGRVSGSFFSSSCLGHSRRHSFSFSAKYLWVRRLNRRW